MQLHEYPETKYSPPINNIYDIRMDYIKLWLFKVEQSKPVEKPLVL